MEDRACWYELRDGRRHVLPYEYTYNSHVKRRWRGRGVFEVMAYEFLGCSDAYLRSAAAAGRILLNGKRVSDGDCFRDGDLLSHIVVRNEPSVPDEEIKLLCRVAVATPSGPAEAGQPNAAEPRTVVLVVHKPAGMPVHPAGRFRRNSVVEVLQAQRPELFTAGAPHVLHRLDRQVSGVLILPLSGTVAAELGAALEARRLRKVYLARVRGAFPVGPSRPVSEPIRVSSLRTRAWIPLWIPTFACQCLV